MSVPYHRLPRVDARWRWWRPLVALAVLAGWYVATQVVLAVAYFVPIGASQGPEGLMRFQQDLASGALDPTDPLILSLSLVSLVVLLPGILLAVKLAKLGRRTSCRRRASGCAGAGPRGACCRRSSSR